MNEMATVPSPSSIRALPQAICFRVTRFCNARCSFCLAPPDGSHPSGEILAHRLDWLLGHGARIIHFCGGEPTIHSALPGLLGHVRANGGKTRLTTNGIEISEALLTALRTSETEVKVSLHGDLDHHNAVTGCDAFNRATDNLRRLIAAGISVSVQTTVVKNAEWVVTWAASFCLKSGVRRLSILPFIPRGAGSARRVDFELSTFERRRLRERVSVTRRTYSGRLDVRWLDFTAQPIHVVEADGRVILEGLTETMDRLVCRIP